MDAAPREERGGVLVAAVGHAWLRDQSFGIKVVERLRSEALPADVVLADWSFGTVTAFQKLCERRWRRAIFVAGVARGREPGVLYRFRRDAPLPSPEEIHARIGDGVMGMLSLDNLLIMSAYYRALPDDVVQVEVEPVDDAWGGELSPGVAALFERAVAAVLAEIHRPDDPGAGAHIAA